MVKVPLGDVRLTSKYRFTPSLRTASRNEIGRHRHRGPFGFTPKARYRHKAPRTSLILDQKESLNVKCGFDLRTRIDSAYWVHDLDYEFRVRGLVEYYICGWWVARFGSDGYHSRGQRSM